MSSPTPPPGQSVPCLRPHDGPRGVVLCLHANVHRALRPPHSSLRFSSMPWALTFVAGKPTPEESPALGHQLLPVRGCYEQCGVQPGLRFGDRRSAGINLGIPGSQGMRVSSRNVRPVSTVTTGSRLPAVGISAAAPGLLHSAFCIFDTGSFCSPWLVSHLGLLMGFKLSGQ